jgi:hypothetical protein
LFEGRYREIVMVATGSSGANPTLILVRSSVKDLNVNVEAAVEAGFAFGVITSFNVFSGRT